MRLQGRSARARHVFACDKHAGKAWVGAEGFRGAVSPAGMATPLQGTLWDAGVGAHAAPGAAVGCKGRRGRGTPGLPVARSREGTRALSVEGEFLYFDDNFPAFGAVRFLVSSSPSAELLHVVDTAIVF